MAVNNLNNQYYNGKLYVLKINGHYNKLMFSKNDK